MSDIVPTFCGLTAKEIQDLQQRNAELAAQVNQLKEEKAELIAGQEILKEGLLAASEHLPLRFADPFFRNDGKLFLKLRDREVAARAVDLFANETCGDCVSDEQVWLSRKASAYANKIKSGEVKV